MIRSMEWFFFVSILDLNMNYYHIKLGANAQKPVNVYGLDLDVFQIVISKLVQDMEYVKTSILS
jgi:hypothetical protein